jgi:hypothetical protein
MFLQFLFILQLNDYEIKHRYSQGADGSDSQPGNWEELFYFLHRLGTERFQEQGWQEPYESRDSRTVLGGTGGETPPVYPTLQLLLVPEFTDTHTISSDAVC